MTPISLERWGSGQDHGSAIGSMQAEGGSMRRERGAGPSRRRMRRGRMARWVGLVLALCSVLAMLPTAARAITGRAGVLVVLCNFKNQQVQPNPVSYYDHMFAHAGAGEMGAWEYWY